MLPIERRIYCPKCKEKHIIEIGTETTIEYNGNYFLLACCPKCNINIASKTMEIEKPFEKYEINNLDFAKVVDTIRYEVQMSFKYNDNTSEDVLENEVCEKIKERYGLEVFEKNEYEIKHLIQLYMSHTYNTPEPSALESYVYEDIKKESRIVSTTMW